MIIKTNKIFDNYLKQFSIDLKSVDFTFTPELEQLVSGDLFEQNDILSLTSLSSKNESSNSMIIENLSNIEKFEIEDFDNHFHVENYLSEPDRNDIKKIIEAGLKTIMTLVEKFKDANKADIQFDFSFETKELGLLLAKEMNIDDCEHFDGCRISFYKKRRGIPLTPLDEYKFNGVMTIEI